MLECLVNKLAKTSPQPAHKLWLKTVVFTQVSGQVFRLGINDRVVRFLNTSYRHAFTHTHELIQRIELVGYKHNSHSLLMKLKESKVII